MIAIILQIHKMISKAVIGINYSIPKLDDSSTASKSFS